MDIYLYLNDQQTGPYTKEQLRAMLASGTINPAQLAWHDGLAGWQPLNTILSTAPVAPPPPPRARQTATLKRGLIQCKACGNPVSKSAKSCPSCGAPLKRRSSCGGCLGLFIILIVVGAITSAISQKGETQSTSAPATNTLQPVANVPPAPEPKKASVTEAKPPAAQIPAATNAPDKSAPAPPTPPPPEQWTTTDGKTYENVTIIRHDATNVTINSSAGTATFPISHLDQNLQKRINDDHVTASDWIVNGKTYPNVKVVKMDEDSVTILDSDGGARIDLADLPTDLQKKFNYDPNHAPTQEEANALVGLTKQELIKRFGQPIRDEKNDSPDGSFEQIVFDDSQTKATFFMLFDKDGTYDGVFYPGGTVSSGSYRGLSFPAKTSDQIAADKAKPVDPKKDTDAFIQTLASMGVDNTIVHSVSVDGDLLTIVVTDDFHVAPYQTRLQVAQNFEKLWTAIHNSHSQSGGSPISITDYNGNEVGGTGMFGVWVQKQ